ncbi:uncharacterized protein K02A2.6-like [Wyeomyia smithii]|uniref:uncharacterized protein K02A2.6-like n=1 Tax=Wyeomyia smithii TaxID=174621 RepID=UPI0024680612|nr:uncharacterized protein K02A2.6-like [Wyeomyia smithii]
MPLPIDLPSLRSYLGAVNCYGKCVRELRKLWYPMDQFMKAGTKWEWNKTCQDSFDHFKELMMSPLVLTHYNPQLDIVVSADVSSIDLLTRLINAHIRPDEEYVIASFELESTFLDVVHQSQEVFPLTFKSIQAKTRADPVLQNVLQHIQQDWPTKKTDVTDSCQQSNFVKTDCQLFSTALPTNHPCVERMRAVARSYVYWPGIDECIAKLVLSCAECGRAAKTNTSTNLESWSVPENSGRGCILITLVLLTIGTTSSWSMHTQNGWRSTELVKRHHQLPSKFWKASSLASETRGHLLATMNASSLESSSRGSATPKRTLKKITAGGEGLTEAINTFLLCYRSTPCRSAPEEKSPAEITLGRTIRTSLDLLRPPTVFHKTDHSKQDDQYNCRHGSKEIRYNSKDLVWTKVLKNNSWSKEADQAHERIGNVSRMRTEQLKRRSQHRLCKSFTQIIVAAKFATLGALSLVVE